MKLRPYQKRCFDSILAWISDCDSPALVEVATGGGKSFIIAALADYVKKASGKRVLALAPSAELVKQNREKYLLTGNPASVFSASAGGKSTKHPIVFGTPKTVKNNVSKFAKGYALVLIDECHQITPTIKHIIEQMRLENPKIKVIGLSATPYRLGGGYIYQTDPDGNSMLDAVNPYFARLLERVPAHELLEQGYLSKPVKASTSENYDTSNVKFSDKETIDKAFNGRGRLTAAIISDVVSKSQDRQGVMIFAATVQHAYECLESLPSEISAIITGDTPKSERARIIDRFRDKKVKYVVNVAVLTTGFDVSHVDVVALLRATESVALLQQIIGRGLRVAPDKKDCLVLDYAENIERHCPDGDLFSPKIRAGAKSKSVPVSVKCPTCAQNNEFKGRKKEDGLTINEDGNLVDLFGEVVMYEGQPMPAHYGRRCQCLVSVGRSVVQCAHRWSVKECPKCDHENDIAARYCEECKHELVDPNDKLSIDKKTPLNQLQEGAVTAMLIRKWISKRGNDTVKVDFITPERIVPMWYTRGTREFQALSIALYGKVAPSVDAIVNAKHKAAAPKTIYYNKPKGSNYFHIERYL